MSKNIVSVIIANRNGEKFLKTCLASILEERSTNYEVIVIDDASEDKSLEVISKFIEYKQIQLISLNKHAGAAEARNIGIKKSKGKYIFFLDSDTVLQKGWSKHIPAFFKRHPKAGIAQVKLLRKGTNKYDSAGEYLSSLGFLVERARYAEDKGQFDQEEHIFSGKSAGMIARRDIFGKVAGFDKDFKIFLEDTDIMWRTWLAGYQVYFLPEIVVFHAYGTPEKDKRFYLQNKVYYRGCKNTIATLIKNLGKKRLIYILPINISVWTIFAVLFLFKGDFYKGKELLHGISSSLAALPQTWKKRAQIQKNRQISDQELFKKVGTKRSLIYYLGKAIDYLTA